jgi:hypothetical protein
VNQRLLRPVLTTCALTLPLLLTAQAAPKKPASPTPGARPASSTARPAQPAAPAPAAVDAAPVAAAKPATSATRREPEPDAAREPRPAASAPQGEHVRFGLAAGLAAPMSSLGRTRGAGYTAGGFLQGRPEGFPVSLRGDLHYTSFSRKPAVTVDPSFVLIHVTGAAVYDFPKSGGRESPFFATGGLGLYRSTTNDETQTDFGQNLGLGFNFRKIRFQPFVEGRFHFFNDVQFFTLTIAGHL